MLIDSRYKKDNSSDPGPVRDLSTKAEHTPPVGQRSTIRATTSLVSEAWTVMRLLSPIHL